MCAAQGVQALPELLGPDSWLRAEAILAVCLLMGASCYDNHEDGWRPRRASGSDEPARSARDVADLATPGVAVAVAVRRAIP